MSGETSSPDSTRNAADIRQDIADYVLKHTDELADVPCVKEFVDEHGRLTSEIAEAEARQERLAKAKEEYEPLERRVGPCRLALNDAETELAKLYAPLGDAVFKALIADDIDEQPVFADRLAAHKRVQLLQAECDALLPGADAGMVQKTKAKSKQLAIKAKIKLEERKFGGLQTEIGRKIVEDELDESIQCNQTNELLSQIKDQRDGIASLSAELKEAESELTESGKKLSEKVGLASIGRSKDLDTAIKLGDKNFKQLNSGVATATRELADALSEVDASTLPNTLVPLLEGFAGRTKGFNFASANNYWSELSRRTQLIVGVVVLLAVFFYPAMTILEIINDGNSINEAHRQSAEAGTQRQIEFNAKSLADDSARMNELQNNLEDAINDSKSAPPIFITDVTDFIDNTGVYEGDTLILVLAFGEDEATAQDLSLRNYVGGDAKFIGFQMPPAPHLHMVITIPDKLYVPKAGFLDLLIVTFVCQDGELRYGNVATSIERPPSD